MFLDKAVANEGAVAKQIIESLVYKFSCIRYLNPT